MPTEVVKCSAGAIRDGSDGKLTVGCVNPSPTHPTRLSPPHSAGDEMRPAALLPPLLGLVPCSVVA